MYQPTCKPNQLILGEGQIVIVSGWTPKKVVEKALNPTQYAVIGNLYSSIRGISFLLHNLLANPTYNTILLLHATQEDKVGSCQCLYDFFQNGIEPDLVEGQWRIKSSIEGYIHQEIPFDVLEDLRERCEVFFLTSLSELREKLKEIQPQQVNPPIAPQYFLMPEITTTIFPGPRYGHRIEAKTIAEAWVKLIHRIRTTGTIRPTGYDGNWQELIDLMAVVIDEPDGFYFPDPNYLPCDPQSIKDYLPQVLEDSPYQLGVKYTYGQRLRSWFGQDQIEKVIVKLLKEIDSASGVLSLWDSGAGTHQLILPEDTNSPPAIARYGRKYGDSDHDHGGSPCLNHVWVRVVNEELSLTAVFRSNDMFSAWPSNAMGLRALQQHFVEEINARSDYALRMGPLITLSQSAHIYDDCWESADKLINSQYQQITRREFLEFNDPCGNFAIASENNSLTVEHLSKDGQLLQTFKGRMPMKICHDIALNIPAIQSVHLAYIGIELEKERLRNKP